MTLSRLPHLIGIAAFVVVANTTKAEDARSIALGGSATSLGQGIHGVLANPATLMHLSRKNKNVHLRLGAAVDFRDPGTVFDSVFAAETFVDDIENTTDILSDSPVTCISLTVSSDTTCLSNTEELGEDFASLINEIIEIDEEPIELIADAQAGIGFVKGRVPFALHFGYSVVLSGELIASDQDIVYLTVLQDALIDGELTVGDVIDTAVAGLQLIDLSVDADGTLDLIDPEDVLNSDFIGTRVDRQQLGISLGF